MAGAPCVAERWLHKRSLLTHVRERDRDPRDRDPGALGQALLARGAFQAEDGRIVTWHTSYTRFGSSGRKDAAEPRYGADGVFEIQLTDEDGVTTRKSLLFQAKKENYTETSCGKHQQ